MTPDARGFPRLLPAFLICLGLSILIHLRLADYHFDDAAIYFRIAENFIEFGQPYFNAGQAVKTGTSSGWVLLLSASLWLARQINLSIPVQQLAAVINSVALVCSAFIYLRLSELLAGRKLGTLASSIFLLLYLALCLNSSLGLMETQMALLLAGLGLSAYLKHNKLAYLFLGAAPWFRPELIILLVLIAIHTIVRRRAQWGWLLFLVSMAAPPFLVFDLLFFRTIIPQAFWAKAALYAITTRDSLNIYLSHSVSAYFMAPFYSLFSNHLKVYLFYLTVFLVGLFFWQAIRSKREQSFSEPDEIGLLILLWGLLTLLTYLTRRIYVFPWYLPLIQAPLLTALFAILKTQKTLKKARNLTILQTLPLLFLALTAVVTVCYAAVVNPAYAPLFSEGARTRQYLALGRQLYAKYPAATLLTSEIGGLGYGFRGEILDAGGLASPEAVGFQVKQRRAADKSDQWGTIPLDYIRQKNPDIIVSYEVFSRNFLNSPAAASYDLMEYSMFLTEDRKRAEIQTPWGYRLKQELWGNPPLWVWVKKGLVP